jgi:hypothetical protein
MALKIALVLALVASVAAARPGDPYGPLPPPGPSQPAPSQPAPPQPASPSQPAPPPPPQQQPASASAEPPPPSDPAAALRDANAAATAGEWDRVAATVDPLLAHSLGPADLGEAHRLAGLAAFFHNQRDAAEFHFLAYLRLDLQGHLDPALYPPEAVNFFEGVRARHAAELRARAPKGKRYWVVAPIPVASQIQNGERTKGIVIGSLIGAFAITNVTTYLVLRSWCQDTGSTCDKTGTDHYKAAQNLSSVNVASGIALIAVAAYGVYDGVVGYRRRSRQLTLEPYANPTTSGAMFGIAGSF